MENFGGNGVQVFALADLDELLQEFGAQPLLLVVISDQHGKLCLVEPMGLAQSSHPQNHMFASFRILAIDDQGHFPVVIDKANAGQPVMGDAAVQGHQVKVPEINAFL